MWGFSDGSTCPKAEARRGGLAAAARGSGATSTRRSSTRLRARRRGARTRRVYGDLFGFSQFDPFFTLGARGWIGSEAGNVGPAAGVGAFWHLDDNWSLRFDAGATLCLDGGAEMRYTLAAGVQYGF